MAIGEYYSGFQASKAGFIKAYFEEFKDLFQMAYSDGESLFTHAGVGEQWLADNNYNEEPIADFLNDLWKYTPKVFGFTGNDPYGDSLESSPIWIRPKSLMKGNQNLKKDIIQFVGHTVQNSIDFEGKSTGQRYYFLDVQETSNEYLTIEDRVLKLNKV